MAKLIRPNTCGNCGFSTFEEGQVFCRAHPPTANCVPIGIRPDGQPQVATFANFPPVQPDWWCGEWKARIALMADTKSA